MEGTFCLRLRLRCSRSRFPYRGFALELISSSEAVSPCASHANPSREYRRSCRPRHRQWVSVPPLGPSPTSSPLDNSARRPATALPSHEPSDQNHLAWPSHDISGLQDANIMAVRVCARPVSPVMMLPELFSVSIYFQPCPTVAPLGPLPR
jgi:hypothetical protein